MDIPVSSGAAGSLNGTSALEHEAPMGGLRTPAPAEIDDAELRPYGIELATRVAGRSLADEVEEYFERGARVRSGDVVFDVGANVGAFAAAVAGRTGADVTLHCFEPAGPTYTKLARTFEQHDALGRTRHELHAVALTRSDLDGTELPFYYFKRFPTDSTYDIEHKLTEFRAFFIKKAAQIDGVVSKVPLVGRPCGRTVRAVLGHLCRPDSDLGVWLAWQVTGLQVLKCKLASLEQVVASRGIDRIDLLKIDVEGAELDVLGGCGSAWSIIRQVAIETDERNGRAEQVKWLLDRNGLEIVSCAPPKVAADGDARQVLIIARRYPT